MQTSVFNFTLAPSVRTYEEGSAFENPRSFSWPLQPQERVCGSVTADTSDSKARDESMCSLGAV